MSHSPIPVVVLDSTPSFRRGLEAAFTAAGHLAHQPDDVEAWCAQGSRRAVVGTAQSEADLNVLIAAAGHPEVVAVALIHGSTPADYARPLLRGIHGVALWNADPDEIVTLVEMAASGRTVLPSAVAGYLAKSSAETEMERPSVTAEEAAWLLALSRGATVVALADDVGYSERAMFRKLHDLYVRLGAHNRSEALVAAQRLGLLDTAR